MRRYWRLVNPTPNIDYDSVLWMAKQCKGIAEGVMRIHKYKSSRANLLTDKSIETVVHHGDIKPENILWFPENDGRKDKTHGTLKLSDFGLAEVSVHQTTSMQPKSKFATSPHYRAPEVDLEGTGAIGRSYDIWTLGCLFLEFITWQLGGWNLVGSFLFSRIEDYESHLFMQFSGTFFRIHYVNDGRRPLRVTAEIKHEVLEVSSCACLMILANAERSS